jgi:hypothetical protein
MCTAKGRVPGEKPGTSAACREDGPQRAIIAKGSYSELWRCLHKAEVDPWA